MKQKLISRLVVGALAGVAATSAFAGQIQASSVSIAREVITDDAQPVTSPSVSYRFNGDVDARFQNQTFQVQFTLGDAAKWAAAGTVAHVTLTDGVTGTAGTIGTNHGNYTVNTVALSADKKTLYATITVYSTIPGNAAGLIKQPIVAISSSATVANNPTANTLKSVVGTIGECDTLVKTLPVSVKHFVALSDPSALATETTATADEHLRPSSTNSTTLITFPTNILVQVTKTGGDAKLDVSQSQQKFAGTTSTLVTSFISATQVNLGQVNLKQNASGYDSNLLDPYILADATLPGVSGIATAVHGSASAAGAAGDIEAEKFAVKVAASQGFVVGGTVFLSTQISCASTIGTATATITSGTAAGPITLTIGAADINASFGAAGTNKINVCYTVPGTTVVPASVFSVTEARLDKAPGTTYEGEQDNYCKGDLYALSGSIKIDVRNYAANGRTDGWMSVVRLINTSESRTATVYGQYIHADGKYGKWGKLADLSPRAVLNMTPAQVDAKLTSAPAHPTTANNATAALGTTGDAPRLRITTETGDTLRVQNYLYNPASENFIEASGSQGVDFTGSTDRAPTMEGQYTEQDAQKGLNGGN